MSNMLQPCMTDSVVESVGGNVGGLLEQEKGGFHALFIELLGTVGAMCDARIVIKMPDDDWSFLSWEANISSTVKIGGGEKVSINNFTSNVKVCFVVFKPSLYLASYDDLPEKCCNLTFLPLFLSNQ